MASDADTESAPVTEIPGESVYVETNGVRLHTVQAGPEDGPLVVLLHGFPEFWYGWCDQIRPLANAGYRVVVPDQRGYNLSDKPDDLSAYRIEELAADVVGILDALDRDTAAVVGHDWGAAVAWWVALHYPDRVDHLGVLNVPHPTVFRRTLKRSFGQKLRSWYMGFFQIPLVPERLSKAGDFRLLVRTMRQSSEPGTFSPSDFERYRQTWRRPGAFTGMVNWYRAAARSRPEPENGHVKPPTLVIWGAKDQFLKKSMARESVDMCERGRLVMLDDATHWVQHEEPVRVSELLKEFLAE
ncbi:alpha/beta fold hydrolase [Haloprofundus sp. MHR1]|uniref:alpha/beta fold hydrolase n=1 Tax=Haloprofundus sp. MHR1 TaxID=2572921 RepID=UPI0010BE4D53|nr:alpha/beta fold hydrolase [Haloprofundus sp. MHR1]QCJ46318.1 alpha/beta fold hydrolase [Haloprofundus sp. MHR1]